VSMCGCSHSNVSRCFAQGAESPDDGAFYCSSACAARLCGGCEERMGNAHAVGKSIVCTGGCARAFHSVRSRRARVRTLLRVKRTDARSPSPPSQECARRRGVARAVWKCDSCRVGSAAAVTAAAVAPGGGGGARVPIPRAGGLWGSGDCDAAGCPRGAALTVGAPRGGIMEFGGARGGGSGSSHVAKRLPQRERVVGIPLPVKVRLAPGSLARRVRLELPRRGEGGGGGGGGHFLHFKAPRRN
jgi:hypothetical protein